MSEYIVKCNEVVGISGKALIVPDYIDTSKEIVRCRDCKHYEITGNCHYWASYEPIPGGDEFMEVLGEVTADGFCAWAVRRDG